MSNEWLNFDICSDDEYEESPFLGMFSMRPTGVCCQFRRPLPPFVQKPSSEERSSDSSDSSVDELPILSVGLDSFPTYQLVC